MTATFYVGDAIEVMGQLPEKSVDLILSSPPFLALRSYLPSDHPDKALEGGSQSTPGEYIDWLIDVVEACARVLAPHGSLCFELGDTYSSHDYGTGGDQGDGEGSNLTFKTEDGKRLRGPFRPKHYGTDWPLAKSLSLIPELFRLALVYGQNPLTGRQTERWRLRNVIRWVRPNPPVGALGDKFRPATSELMVFCKSAKRYFDLDAVRGEPVHGFDWAPGSTKGHAIEQFPRGGGDANRDNHSHSTNPAGAPPLDWWNIPLLDGEEETKYGPGEKPKAHARTAKGVEAQPRAGKSAERGGNWASLPELHETLGAPPLDWWEIPPGGYQGSHYAVWPPELCVKPIKAMCPEKVCRVCGEPRRRIAEYSYDPNDPSAWGGRAEWSGARPTPTDQAEHKGGVQVADGKVNPSLFKHGRAGKQVNTLGFSDCGHNDYRPGLVLDPFAGSGTTLAVATGHGRDAIGVDLDERNYELALDRVGPLILVRGEVAA